jgi:hypothetical protein
MVGTDSRNNIDKELMKIEDPIQRREIKHDIFLESKVKGFRQIKDPLKGGSKKWYIEDDLV